MYLNLAFSYLSLLLLLGVVSEGTPGGKIIAVFSMLILAVVIRRAHKAIGISHRLRQQELEI